MGRNKGMMALAAASIVLVATVGCSTSTTQAETTSITNTQATQPLLATTINSEYFTAKEQNFDYETNGAYYIKFNGNTISGDGVTISGTTMTITSPGVYILSGTLTDGQIIVQSPEKGHVQLVLDNAIISSKDTAAIWVKESDKTIITLPKDTNNTISDSGTYVDGDDLPSATIFSKDDLVINGTGTLNVEATLNDAITSRDDLKVIGATVNVNSADDGFVGKDSVAITNANINVTSVAEGIKSSNETDEGKGVVYIDGGDYTINAGNDGIQSVTLVEIVSGNVVIKAVDDAIHSAGNVVINGGIIDITESYEGIEGLNITINDGEISVVASDDGINVAGGTDSSFGGGAGRGAMGKGELPEGMTEEMLETMKSEMKSRENMADGEMPARENMPTGEMPQSTNGDVPGKSNIGNAEMTDNGTKAPDANTATESTTPANVANITKGLTINGGDVTVKVASGDGIDINGSGVMNGGSVIVYGPLSGADSALDYDVSFVVNGGTFVGFDGTNQMRMVPGTSETQNTISVNFEQTLEAGTEVTVKTSSGSVIGTYKAEKTFQNIMVSSADLKTGEKYVVLLNGSEYVNFTISEGTTYLNTDGVTTAQSGKGMGGGKNRDMTQATAPTTTT